MPTEAQHKISATAQVKKISEENPFDNTLFPLAAPLSDNYSWKSHSLYFLQPLIQT